MSRRLPVANAANIRAAFTLERGEATRLARTLRDARTHVEKYAAIDYANTIIAGHGIEPVRGDYYVDQYYDDTVALYVNTGDLYTASIIYDTVADKFYATDLGEWMEARQKKYKVY